MKKFCELFCLLTILVAHPAAAQTTNANAPAVLPGQGLAQHDFFYAGEAKVERMLMVRGGKIIWDYTHPGRGEISDAVLESEGNILFAPVWRDRNFRRQKSALEF